MTFQEARIALIALGFSVSPYGIVCFKRTHIGVIEMREFAAHLVLSDPPKSFLLTPATIHATMRKVADDLFPIARIPYDDILDLRILLARDV